MAAISQRYQPRLINSREPIGRGANLLNAATDWQIDRNQMVENDNADGDESQTVNFGN